MCLIQFMSKKTVLGLSPQATQNWEKILNFDVKPHILYRIKVAAFIFLKTP